MSEINVELTADVDLVFNLLFPWKVGAARVAASNNRDRVRLVAVDEETERHVGALVGHHDSYIHLHQQGYEHIDRDNDAGSVIEALWVGPANRSHGVGTALLNRFMTEASAAGKTLVIAHPDEGEAENYDHRIKFFIENEFAWMQPVDYLHRAPWLMSRQVPREH